MKKLFAKIFKRETKKTDIQTHLIKFTDKTTKTFGTATDIVKTLDKLDREFDKIINFSW